jgi:PAS domain S-box-containing protein
VNKTPTKILLVEDSESDADLLQAKLHAGGLGIFDVTWATRLDQAIGLLRRTAFEAILTDMNLPDSSGKETFLSLRAAAPNLAIVVLTGADDEQLGLDAVRHGIQDYLVKGSADGPQIARAIRYAVERVRTREELRRSEERYRTLFESMTEGFIQYEIVFDECRQPVDYRCVEINSAFERLTGLKRANVIGRTRSEAGPPASAHALEIYRTVATTGEPASFETRLPGLNKHFAASVYRPAPNRLSLVFRDISERILRESELQKLNRTLKALSNSNQAILHATDESVYLQDVCRIITEDCGHVMVWIGFAGEDAGRTVRPVAHAGFDEDYLEGLNITWADTERGRGPTGTAIRTGKAFQCPDMVKDPAFAPWSAEALKRGYAASLAIPLIAQDRTLGAITIYSRQTNPFTAEELALLTELAGDVTHGLTSLRLRAAHQRAEQATREQEEELVAIYENAPVTMLLLDDKRQVQKANKEAERFVGASAAELLGRPIGEALRCLHAADDPRGCGYGPHCQHCALRQLIGSTIETGRGHRELEVAFSTTTAAKRQDHTFLLSTLRLTVRGQARALATMQDITLRKQAEDTLNFLAHCGQMSGEDFFQALARYLAETLGMDFVCIDRLIGDGLTARTEAMFVNGKFEDNVSYALRDTPCGEVVGKTVCCFPARVRHLFAKDAVLQEMAAESYVGVTLWAHRNPDRPDRCHRPSPSAQSAGGRVHLETGRRAGGGRNGTQARGGGLAAGPRRTGAARRRAHLPAARPGGGTDAVRGAGTAANRADSP